MSPAAFWYSVRIRIFPDRDDLTVFFDQDTEVQAYHALDAGMQAPYELLDRVGLTSPPATYTVVRIAPLTDASRVTHADRHG